MQKKFFDLLFSSLQESMVIFKKGHFRKIQKKSEILASSEILFLFIVDTYKTNKK
jgi:hypothetical protein